MGDSLGDRSQARHAVDELGAVTDVVATSLIEPDADPTRCWTIEATVDAYGIPPRILGVCQRCDLVVREVTPRGDHYRLVASVV